MQGQFRFSFGPWNIHEGADPFGPDVRKSIPFNKKLELYKDLGFDGVQFHDDDVVPDISNKSKSQIIKEAEELKKVLDDHELTAEFVAPRLWMDPRTIDGGFTSNCPECRNYAIERLKTTADLATVLGARNVVFWFAREGTYIRESKDPVVATEQLADAIQTVLDYNKDVRILSNRSRTSRSITRSVRRSVTRSQWGCLPTLQNESDASLKRRTRS